MPAGRFLSKTVATDEALNRLSWQAQAIYLMTIPHLDRDGLITGHPLLLMAQVAPLRAAELVSTMADLIQEWIAVELVLLYHDASDGQPVLFFKDQELGIRYTRETPSTFAPPPGYERTPDGLIPGDTAAIAPTPDAAPVAPDQLATNSGVTHDQLMTSSGVTHDQLMTGSGVSHDQLATNSGVTHDQLRSYALSATAATAAKQQGRNKESKNQDLSEKSSSSTSSRARGQPDPRISGLGKALPGTSSRTRVQPDPRASPAAKGAVKPDVYQALKAFGVAEPALSELSRNGIDRAMVDGWIAYLATQDMARPVGYLVKRLRAHQQPPPVPEEEDPDSYEALKRKYAPKGWDDVVIT